MTTTIRAKFSLRALRMAATCRAIADIRYYLNGIHVLKYPDGPGVLVCGCDGHAAAIVHDADGDIVGASDITIAIKPGLLAAAARVKSKPDMIAVLDGQRLSINSRHGAAHDETEQFVSPGPAQMTGKFPDIIRVIPEFSKLKPCTAGAVNPKYLSQANDLASIGAGRFSGVRLWSENPQSAVAVQFMHIHEALMIIMPMRDDACGFDLLAKLERRKATRPAIGTPLPGKQPSDAAPTYRQRSQQHQFPPV